MTTLELLHDYLKNQGYHVTRSLSASVLIINKTYTLHIFHTTKVSLFHILQQDPTGKLPHSTTSWKLLAALDLNDPDFFAHLDHTLTTLPQ